MRKFVYLTLAFLSFCTGTYADSPWIQKMDFGGEARHRATGFSIGNRGYMGLGHVNSIVDILYDDIWEYDPGTNSWTQKANFGGGLRYHAVGFSIGNKGYVGTGRVPGGSYENDLWEYDPTTNMWTPKADMPAVPRRGAVSFVVNGEGYVGTGQTSSGYGNDFMKYNPISDSWFPVPPLPGPARTSAVAFNIGNKGYVGTGGYNDFYEYNPTTNSWTPKANVSPITRMEATGFAVGGKGYIGTGDNFSSGTNYDDFWEYDPATDTWVEIEEFGGIARRYLASFSIGDKAYCGTGTSGTNYRDFWEFDPSLIPISVSEKHKPKIQISIYPNPVSELLIIKINSADFTKNSVHIFNSNGQLIINETMAEAQKTIDCSNLGKGSYVVTVIDEQEKIVNSQTILVQ